MLVLVKKQIREKIESGELIFKPSLDKFQLQSHSVDLRLGYTFLIYKNWKLSNEGRTVVQLDYEESRDHFQVIELEEGQYFEILPREYVIVSTLEEIKMPRDIMAILYPRSSVNRRGLSVDLNGIIDAGYRGNLIVPMRNNTQNQVVRIYPGERFCQLLFHTLSSKARPRKSRYAKKDIIVGFLGERYVSETRLVRSGKIKELKRKYALNLRK